MKTAGKAGAIEMQHNQAQARTASAGLKVRPGVKADAPAVSEIVVTKDLDCPSTNLR